MLDGFDPDVYHPALHERFDPFSSVACEKPEPVHVVRASTPNFVSSIFLSDMGNPPYSIRDAKASIERLVIS
jgi:hypothetical protein